MTKTITYLLFNVFWKHFKFVHNVR